MSGLQPTGASHTAGAQAIGRAAEVLRAVAALQRAGAPLAAITRTTGLSRSTAFRILRALVEERLLDFDPAQRRYVIGPLAFELGLAAPEGRPDSLWTQRIEAISRTSGLTAYLVARSGADVVCLATAQGSSVIRAVPLVVGQRLPLGVGAGSLAILATLPDDEVNALLSANAGKIAQIARGRATPALLRARIAQARADGHAFSRDSVAPGVAGVGVVVTRPHEAATYSVSVAAAAELDRAEQLRLAALMREVCACSADG